MLLGDVMEGGGDEEAGATRGDAEVVGRGVDEDAEADASDDDAKLSSLGCAILVCFSFEKRRQRRAKTSVV